jgi:hypothetical protein
MTLRRPIGVRQGAGGSRRVLSVPIGRLGVIYM